jgi:lipopolysaccharide/colanic/teichoic acid biosynthesis glycosyltransferase
MTHGREQHPSWGVRNAIHLAPLSPTLLSLIPDQVHWLERYPSTSARPGYEGRRRLLDLALVTLSAPLWGPVFFGCAALIKLESPRDPLFFAQRRTGAHGERFRMYKFRTMVTNAEELKATLQEQNELRWPDFSIKNDPRVTRAGKLLRRAGLDELPQLLNVLKGDMTLVGPRPTSFGAETYSLWHTERLEVTPGVTGLWQLLGRGTMEFDDRLRLDIAYIERRSSRLDLAIVWRTALYALKTALASVRRKR